MNCGVACLASPGKPGVPLVSARWLYHLQTLTFGEGRDSRRGTHFVIKLENCRSGGLFLNCSCCPVEFTWVVSFETFLIPLIHLDFNFATLLKLSFSQKQQEKKKSREFVSVAYFVYQSSSTKNETI